MRVAVIPKGVTIPTEEVDGLRKSRRFFMVCQGLVVPVLALLLFPAPMAAQV